MFQRIFITLASIVLLGAQAMSAYQVTAQAVSSDGEGIAYATYRIFKPGQDKAVVSNTTGVNGDVAQTLKTAGEYTVTFSYVGMNDTTLTFTVSNAAPTAALGKVVMSEASEMLHDVTVTAQKPLVVKEIDRIGYDVQADPDTKTSNLRDILRKVPMVSVDADGTIKVNGSTDFKIYKNGRPNNSMSRNAKDLFAALPASTIKKIEVITEPGATEDAEGTSAILNIVTNSDTVINGVMGNVSANYDTNNNFPFLGAYLQTQINKVTVSAYGGYARLGGRNANSRSETYSLFKDTGVSRSSTSESDYDGEFSYFGLEGSYELDSLNLFTAEVSGYYNNVNPTGTTKHYTHDAAGTLLGSFTEHSSFRKNRYFDVDANFNYQHNTHRKGEVYTLSYMVSTTHQERDATNVYEDFFGTETQPYTGLRTDYSLNFIEHTFQADYSRKLGNHNLEGGLKWIIRRNHSITDNEYIGWKDVDNEFSHITNIGAAYAQYGYRVGPVNLRAGLRYEFSRLKATYPDGSNPEFATNLNDLVPSAAASWQINDANTLSVNYAASISRPGISYLNPAVTVTPTSVSFGNPDLESARRQSVKLTYMLIKSKFNINFSANYGWRNNAISGVTYVTDGDIINSTYANIGKSRDLSFRMFAQWSITPKTRLMLNGGVTYAQAEQEGYKLSRWAPNCYVQASQELPWKLGIEAGLFYWGGGLNGVYGYSKNRFSQQAYFDLSLRRSFLKDDRLNVRLSVSNPFGSGTRCYESVTVNGPYTGWSRYYRDHAFSVRIGVSFRFGSLRAQVKKVARGIENDDLEGRKSGAGAGNSSQSGN